MSKFTFLSSDIKNAFLISKLIKPLSGDFSIKFADGNLIIFSSDKRRCVKSIVKPQQCESDFISDEYYLPIDKSSFLDSDLDFITMTFTEKSINIKTESSGQSRQASIRKRAENSRRPLIPLEPSVNKIDLNANEFEELIRQVSCSALIRETKTDEDMKINQVHFYSDKSCAVANARFYATVATMPGMSLDISIISSDLPIIRSFCSKSDLIKIGNDKSHLCISNSIATIWFNNIASSRPPFIEISNNDYSTVLLVDRDQLAKNLQWCSLAIDGTQRISVNAFDNEIQFLNGNKEISKMPIEFINGSKLISDFPIKVLCSIVKYIGTGKSHIKFDHSKFPGVLELTEESSDGTVRARHFISSMKDKK